MEYHKTKDILHVKELLGLCPHVSFGSSRKAFGAPGLGGSFAFADPSAQIGYAYAMTDHGYYVEDDPREKSLRDALYRCLKKMGEKSFR